MTGSLEVTVTISNEPYEQDATAGLTAFLVLTVVGFTNPLRVDALRHGEQHLGLEDQLVTVDTQLFYSVLSALPYLVQYPYECTEQTASRLLPIFGLHRILSDFGLGELKDRARRAASAWM